MGADPTTSRVTGECSTVELQPQTLTKIARSATFVKKGEMGARSHFDLTEQKCVRAFCQNAAAVCTHTAASEGENENLFSFFPNVAAESYAYSRKRGTINVCGYCSLTL